MSQIPNENDDDNLSVVASDFIQFDQSDEVPDQEAEAQQHDSLDWVIDTETTTVTELKLMMSNFEAKNQMLQGKVEILESKVEICALNLKGAEQKNESFQYQQTKGIPYDVQLTKADNETYFGFKIGTRENQTHHYITAIMPGSATMRTGCLHVLDSFIAINGTRVESMTHQEVGQLIRAAGNQLTITIDPNYRMANGVIVSRGDLSDSSASSIHNNYARLGPKSHIVDIDEEDKIYGNRKSQRGSASMRLVWVPCILMAISCGMLLYGNFFPANSTKQAPMAEKSDATHLDKQFEDLNDRIGQFMDVVDGQKALLKSQNGTIAELSAKNEQQAKEIDQMIKEANAHKELEKLHIQTIEALRAKIDNIDKEHSRTIGQKSVDAGEDEKKENGQKAETVDLSRVTKVEIFCGIILPVLCICVVIIKTLTKDFFPSLNVAKQRMQF